jgi:tripartite ATP-independent transporter DctM subunit
MWLDTTADRVSRAIVPVSRGLNSLGSSLALAMVFFITANVLTRALFRTPLLGVVELEEVMLTLMVFAGMAFTQLEKQHIDIDFFTSRLAPAGRNLLACATLLLCSLLYAALGWQSLDLGWTYYLKSMATMQVKIPLWPVMLVIGAGFILLALATLRDTLLAVSQALKDGLGRWAAIALAATALIALSPWLAAWSGAEVDPFWVKLLGSVGLVIILFTGMHIGAGLAFLGALGMALLYDPTAGLGLLKTTPFSSTASYALCVIPFFVLMGEVCFNSGISEKLYRAAYTWVGHFKGGLAMATVLACGAFAAVSGSSLATTATLGAVALPEMRRYGYDDALSTGSIAAGGTVGILIPPSVIFIIYGVLVEQSIGELFAAGVLPGLLFLLYYCIAIAIWTKINPQAGPPGPRTTLVQKIYSIRDTWEVLTLFVVVMGGIYGGVFTATEAGAIGAVGALIFALMRKRVTKENMFKSLLATGRTTSMVFLVVIGTAIYGYFLTSTQLPMELAEWVVSLPIPRTLIFLAVIAVYFVLGCLMGTLPLVFITVPIFAPVMDTLGFDLIWFGVIVVFVAEIGLITPPVGMNVFIMGGMAKDVPLATVFRGVMPFLVADVVLVITLLVFPQLALWLPQMLR